MTLLVASMFVSELDALEERCARAWSEGADAVELRLDRYPGPPAPLAEFLRRHADRQWIVTCRPDVGAGLNRESAARRLEKLRAATAGSSAWIDVDAADHATLREGRHESPAEDGSDTSRVIVSHHDFTAPPTDLRDLAKRLLAESPSGIAKIAYATHSAADGFPALDAQRKFGSRLAAIAMGEAGLWTRILAKKLGAWASYAAAETQTPTAPGQIDVHRMIHHFRWPNIGPDTRVYGLLGDPVAHSLSPRLFNAWFSERGINAVYVPLPVTGGEEGLRLFLDECTRRPWLDIAGFSVTVPHKEAALRWVGDGADRAAQGVGAVNTLAFRPNRVAGHNTDVHAAIDILAEALGCRRTELAGISVDVLGAGGAARAVVDGLCDFGARVTIYGRSPQRTKALAESFHAVAAPWNALPARSGDVVVNCTTVGMWPNVNDTPASAEHLRNVRLVFDLVYNPLETKLLREAKAAGAATANGLEMFIRQAAMQFALWTHMTPDLEQGRALARQSLQTREAHS